MTPLVELQIEGPLARITLNRPPLNILSIALRHQLNAALERIETENGIRVVLFGSAGERAFSVGSDLKEFPADETGGRDKIEFEQRQLERIERLEAITVTSLRGFALGGGAELMLATDIRIASENAEIGFPEVKVGGFPAAGGVWRLARDIGPVRARHMLLLGRPIAASDALQWGLIQETVPAQDLAARVDERAAELAALPHASLRAIKRCLAACCDGRLSAAAGGIERFTTDEYGQLYRGPDIFEGLHSFCEKRQPRYNRSHDKGQA